MCDYFLVLHGERCFGVDGVRGRQAGRQQVEEKRKANKQAVPLIVLRQFSDKTIIATFLGDMNALMKCGWNFSTSNELRNVMDE